MEKLKLNSKMRLVDGNYILVVKSSADPVNDYKVSFCNASGVKLFDEHMTKSAFDLSYGNMLTFGLCLSKSEIEERTNKYRTK